MNSTLLRNFYSLKIVKDIKIYSIKNFNSPLNKVTSVASFHTTPQYEAARKGTRARREAVKKANKKKKMAELERQKAIPLTQKQLLEKYGAKLPRRDFSFLPLPPEDDVYVARYFQWKIYDLEDAINCHRETHHPTQYNEPNAPLNLFIELSLSVDKKNRYLSSVSGLAILPHSFETGQERSIAAIVEDVDTQEKLKEMGCHLVGGKELVKLILDGEINIQQYEYVIASVDIMPQLVPARQVMKRKFPSAKSGTAVLDVLSAVKKYLTGLKFEAEKNEYDPDYASLQVTVGNLSMTNEQLSANVKSLLEEIHRLRGDRKTSDIITKVFMMCPPTKEKFILDHRQILELNSSDNEDDEKIISAAN